MAARAAGADPAARPGAGPHPSAGARGLTGSGEAGRRTGPAPDAPWSTPRTGPPPGRRSSPSSGRAGPGQSASEDTRANPGRASSGGPGGPTAISPATSSSSSRRAADQVGAPGRAGIRPRPGSPATSTWTRTVAPGAPAGDGPALLDPGHALPPRHHRGQAGHLVPLHGPEEVPGRCGGRGRRRRLTAAGLGHQLVGVVLPDVGQPGGQGGLAPRRRRTPWSPPRSAPTGGVGGRRRRCAGGPRPAGGEPARVDGPGPVAHSGDAPVADQTTRAWRPRSRGPGGRSSRRRRRCRRRRPGTLGRPAGGQGRRHGGRQVEGRPPGRGPAPDPPHHGRRPPRPGRPSENS